MTCLYRAVILSSKETFSIKILSLIILEYNIIKTVVSRWCKIKLAKIPLTFIKIALSLEYKSKSKTNTSSFLYYYILHLFPHHHYYHQYPHYYISKNNQIEQLYN